MATSRLQKRVQPDVVIRLLISSERIENPILSVSGIPDVKRRNEFRQLEMDLVKLHIENSLDDYNAANGEPLPYVVQMLQDEMSYTVDVSSGSESIPDTAY